MPNLAAGSSREFRVWLLQQGRRRRVAARPEWRPGVYYSVGDVRTYEGEEYTCIAAHQAQFGFPPNTQPQFWAPSETPEIEFLTSEGEFFETSEGETLIVQPES